MASVKLDGRTNSMLTQPQTAGTPTHLTFQHNGQQTTLQTKVASTVPFSALDDQDQSLFKSVSPSDDAPQIVATTAETIFHPQGGGQPSDLGTMTSDTRPSIIFNVTTARTSVSIPGIVYHLGHFKTKDEFFESGELITQEINSAERLRFSKLHTAGHILGSAVRHVCEKKIENFDELKASHFPGQASCEFQGSIPGTYKERIQAQVDEFVKKNMAVEIDWWDEEDFKKEGKEALMPDKSFLVGGDTKFRIVRIVGAEVYPCGGTHVQSSGLCGRIVVKKISRSKGTSRVSYEVEEC